MCFQKDKMCILRSVWNGLKPIFHCDAKPFALGPGVGLDPQLIYLMNYTVYFHTYITGRPGETLR